MILKRLFKYEENSSDSAVSIIQRRRSTRKFKQQPVCINDVRRILEYAGYAPSPKNDQPWYFVVVKGKSKDDTVTIMRDALQELTEENKKIGIARSDIDSAFKTIDSMQSAPVIIFVYLENQVTCRHDDGMNWELHATDVECTHIQAIGAAIQNMLLAATELGLDSLWIGDIFFAYNNLTEYLGLKDASLMAAVALGYGEDDSCQSYRKSVEDYTLYLM